MTILTYSQLEGVWIDNGGQASLAPLMAAIALAESGGQTNALNPGDNNGRQSSYGLWQISTGTHAAPANDWADPNTNARLAIGKLKSQGLGAWGTYTSGAYKPFLKNSVPPTSVGGGVPATEVGESNTNDNTCAWKLVLPLSPDVCVLSKKLARQLLGGVLLIGGGVVVLTGVAFMVVYGLKRSAGPLKTLTRSAS